MNRCNETERADSNRRTRRKQRVPVRDLPLFLTVQFSRDNRRRCTETASRPTSFRPVSLPAAMWLATATKKRGLDSNRRTRRKQRVPVRDLPLFLTVQFSRDNRRRCTETASRPTSFRPVSLPAAMWLATATKKRGLDSNRRARRKQISVLPPFSLLSPVQSSLDSGNRRGFSQSQGIHQIA